MNRTRLLVLGGLAVAFAVALRRRARRDAVEVEIDEPRSLDRTTDEDPATVDLESIEGIGSAYAERLREAGVGDGADLVAADPETLASETGIAEGRIRNWIERTADREAV